MNLSSWVDGGEDDVIVPVGGFDSCPSESRSVCPGTGFTLLSPVAPRHPGAPDPAGPRPLRAIEQYPVAEVCGKRGYRRSFLRTLRSGRRHGRLIIGALVGLMDQPLEAGLHRRS